MHNDNFIDSYLMRPMTFSQLKASNNRDLMILTGLEQIESTSTIMKKNSNSCSMHSELEFPVRPFMKRKESVQAFKRNFAQLRDQIDLPYKSRLYFSILEQAVKNKQGDACLSDTHLIPKTFLKAFSQLSKQQKQHFIYEQIEFMKQSFDHKLPDGTLNYSKESNIKWIETQCQLKKIMFGMAYWVTVVFIFDGAKKNVRMTYKKRTYLIDLRLYIVRKSKKNQMGLVLMRCSDENKDQLDKISFSFEETVYRQVYQEINKCILQHRNQKLLDLVRQKKLPQQSQQLTTIGFNEKALTFFNGKNLQVYLKNKLLTIGYINNNQYDFTTVYNERKSKVMVSNKTGNSFKLETISDQPQLLVSKLFRLRMREKKFKMLIQQQQLQQFSEKYTAVLQRYLIQGRSLEMIAIREEQGCEFDGNIFFLQGISTKGSDCFINFLLARVDEVNSMSKLSVYMTTQQISGLSIDETINFLVQLGSIIDKTTFNQDESQTVPQKGAGLSKVNPVQQMTQLHDLESVADYFTVNQSIQEQQENPSAISTSQINSCDIQLPPIPKNTAKDTNDTSGNTLAKEDRYLNHRFKLTPIDQGGKHRRMKKHPVFSADWKRKNQGGLVCVNQDLLNTQKGVILKIASSVRKLIMSGKSPLNISLPVAIFSQQSHLSILARSFAFTPLILEPVIKSSPVDKIKSIVPVIIAANALGISITKPFNPILGETMQVSIDGCPVYLEQISHHPPVTYYNFYGRGYNLYGSIQPDARLGINSLTASSPASHYITFDTGQKFQMIHSIMQFSGFIFGDRQFILIDKAWIIQRNHKLFAEIRYGPRRKGIFSKTSEPQDFFECLVYQVTDQFLQHFDRSNPYPHKKDIVREISKGEGIWSQSLTVDGQQRLHLERDLPCEIVEEQFPLPSNSWYRADLQKFIEGDVQMAQSIKEEMQDSQRRDKKLREKKGKL